MNLEHTKELIHTLRGVAGNISAQRVQLISSQIEIVLEEDQLLPNKMLIELKEALNEVMKGIMNLKKEVSGAKPPDQMTFDPQKLKRLAKQLLKRFKSK